MKLYEDFRAKTSGDKTLCLNCGAANLTGTKSCENCQAALEQPAPFILNLAETVVRPIRAMRRIAATAPVKQAFMVVLLVVPAYLLLQTVSTVNSLNVLLSRLDLFGTGPGSQAFRANPPALPGIGLIDQILTTQRTRLLSSPAPVPGLLEIGFLFLLLTLSWVFFATAVFYTARLIYRNDARTNWISILSIVGFARVTGWAIPLALLPLPGVVTQALSLLVLLWQLTIIVIGVKFSTGLSWNRGIMVTIIPALIFYFFLQMPI